MAKLKCSVLCWLDASCPFFLQTISSGPSSSFKDISFQCLVLSVLIMVREAALNQVYAVTLENMKFQGFRTEMNMQ